MSGTTSNRMSAWKRQVEETDTEVIIIILRRDPNDPHLPAPDESEIARARHLADTGRMIEGEKKENGIIENVISQ